MQLSTSRIRAAQTASVVVFITMGHSALASVAWVPEFIDRLGVSFITWGTIIGVGVIGSIAPLFFASRLIMRFGARPIIRFANYGGMVMLISLGLTSNPIFWFALNIFFNFFMSLLGVTVNSSAVLLQKKANQHIIGKLHAGWSLGALLAAITGAVSTVFLTLELFLVIVSVLTVLIFEFALRKLLSPEEDGHIEERAISVKREFHQAPPQLWFLALGLFAAIYPEVAVIDWAAVFARDVLNAELALRSIPFAMFMNGMIIGRLSMTRLAEKLHPHTIASRGALLAAVCLALAALFASPVAQTDQTAGLIVGSLLWGLAGLGLAPASPAFFSAAGQIPGVTTAWAISWLSLLNSLVAIFAKAFMGALVEGVGLGSAFFFPVILAIISAGIAQLFAKRARKSDLDSVAPPTGPISIVTPDDAR
jgi:fucose permease